MSSMAATLAGLQPAPVAAPTPAQQQQARRAAGAQAGHIPARYEEALDVEGELAISDVELNGTVSRARLPRRLSKADAFPFERRS
jgi:hypothetical protein